MTSPALDITPTTLEDLYLDPDNPRLAGLDLDVDDQIEILRVLWQERAVNEIAESIAINGFWPHEMLFAAKEKGKLIVIEGNRRLAALKLLVYDELRAAINASGLPTLSDEQKITLREVPIIISDRKALWEYVGFKHVNGPQDWDSVAKAEYIARVHNDYDIPLEHIARTIGDKHNTVQRLYRGLMVLEQAERTGRFSREDRYNTRFAYSHLWTGLGYAGIQGFLGLTPDSGFTPNPVPREKIDNLVSLCTWLYGSKERGIQPLIKSQNPDLRKLDEVLQNDDGIAALQRDLPLETALNVSRGDEKLFREAIVLAEQTLKEARGLVETGYKGDAGLATRVQYIVTIAQSIKKAVDSIRETATAEG